MAEIGIRELKQRVSEIVRRVREKRETIIITYRGRGVARLVPMDGVESKKAAPSAEGSAVWAEMDELAQEVGAHWPPGVPAVGGVQEQRREL